MPADELRIPGLRSASWWRWVVATGVAVVVVCGWVAVTQPENRVWVAVVLPLLVGWMVVLGWTSASLDPATGVLVTRRCRVPRRVALAPGTTVALVPNGAGALLLALRPRGARRRTYLTVLALTDYVEASQSPHVLTQLADTLERHCGGGARGVVRALREQAAHVAAGGTPRTSPLAPMLTYGAITAARLGGAGGVAGHLD